MKKRHIKKRILEIATELDIYLCSNKNNFVSNMMYELYHLASEINIKQIKPDKEVKKEFNGKEDDFGNYLRDFLGL